MKREEIIEGMARALHGEHRPCESWGELDPISAQIYKGDAAAALAWLESQGLVKTETRCADCGKPIPVVIGDETKCYCGSCGLMRGW